MGEVEDLLRHVAGEGVMVAQRPAQVQRSGCVEAAQRQRRGAPNHPAAVTEQRSEPGGCRPVAELPEPGGRGRPRVGGRGGGGGPRGGGGAPRPGPPPPAPPGPGARSAGAHLEDVFDGHEACANGPDDWLNGLKLSWPFGADEEELEKQWDVVATFVRDSFHPNSGGQRGYAEAFTQVWGQ
jgi:hypothetical protein